MSRHGYSRKFVHEQEVSKHPSGVFFRLPEPPNHPYNDEYNYATSPPGVSNTAFPMFHGHSTVAQPALSYYCLPLFNVSMNIEIDSTIAQNLLTQHFHNPSDTLVKESTYSFPLYDGAVVTSFRCTIGDDKVLVGHVKPTAEAHAIFKTAVAEQQAAALLQEHTPEIFEVHLGNLLPKTTVKVEITYVHELKADLNGDGLLLIIPTSIAPRYGSSPLSHNSYSHQMDGNLSITVNVQAPSTIQKLESTSHPVSIEIGNVDSTHEVGTFSELDAVQTSTQPSLNRAKATLSDRNAVLGKDFTLKIVAMNESLMRSQAQWESAPSPGGESAMMVNLNPQELFPQLEISEDLTCEIILLADRSGSMEDKIDRLKEAIQVFLANLPNNCYFNLCSFGSDFSALWNESKGLSSSTRNIILQYLDAKFQADMGGTEILKALQQSVLKRQVSANFTTQIIVLTDGEVWNTEETIDFIRNTRTELSDKIRFFALGIGDAVSHRLIEGIATVGGGFGEVVQVGGQGAWNHRIVRLLAGAVMPMGWSCRVTLEQSTKNSSLTLPTKSTKVAGQSTNLGVQQDIANTATNYIIAPYDNTKLHPYVRQTIFLLFSSSFSHVPKEIYVEMSLTNGQTSTATLPVTSIRSNTNTIHTLAAKAAITDLENDNSWLHESFDISTLGSSAGGMKMIIAREAERLGTTYRISSRWTSFVATESASKQESMIETYRAKQMDLSLLTRPTFDHFNYLIPPSMDRGFSMQSSPSYWPPGPIYCRLSLKCAKRPTNPEINIPKRRGCSHDFSDDVSDVSEATESTSFMELSAESHCERYSSTQRSENGVARSDRTRSDTKQNTVERFLVTLSESRPNACIEVEQQSSSTREFTLPNKDRVVKDISHWIQSPEEKNSILWLNGPSGRPALHLHEAFKSSNNQLKIFTDLSSNDEIEPQIWNFRSQLTSSLCTELPGFSEYVANTSIGHTNTDSNEMLMFELAVLEPLLLTLPGSPFSALVLVVVGLELCSLENLDVLLQMLRMLISQQRVCIKIMVTSTDRCSIRESFARYPEMTFREITVMDVPKIAPERTAAPDPLVISKRGTAQA